MEIVCFGQQNWDFCWTGKQQLMTRLARRGHRILYVDPDSLEDVSGAADGLRALAPVQTGFGLREVADRLFVYTHRHAPLLRYRLNQRRRPALLRATVRKLGFWGAAQVALHPKVLPLIEALPPAPLVYYAVDEATAFPNMPVELQRAFRRNEDVLLGRASVALGVSPRLVQRFRLTQPNSYLLENGADVDHFSPGRLASLEPHPALGCLPRPRIVFVGQVDERIDQDLVAEVAGARPGWQIVLAGRLKDGVDFSRIAALPNVHLIGYQPYEMLPRVLREADACIVPYRLNDLTHACNPLKVFEYLATGRPVVSTPLEGIGVCRPVIEIADGPAAFIGAIERVVANPEEGRRARLALAASHSWDARVDTLEERLDEAVRRFRSNPNARTVAPQLRPAQVASRLRQPANQPRFPETEKLSRQTRTAIRLFSAAGRVYHFGRMTARAIGGRRPLRIRRILVARRSRLGDLIVFLPALEALRRAFPEARIVFASQPGCPAAALLGPTGLVDEIRVLDYLDRETPRDRIRGAIALFREGFDLVLSGEGFFIMREAFYSGAPYRIGHANGHPLQAMNSRVLPFDVTRHEADNSVALVEAASGKPQLPGPPRLALDPNRTAEAANVLRELGVPAGHPFVVIHPGAQKPSRRWPGDRFAALATRALQTYRGLWIVLTGASNERALAERVRDAIDPGVRDRAVVAAGHTDLYTLAGLFDRARALVCNDTGVLHLARARNVPLVAVLGPENDRRWGPYPEGGAPAVALRNEVPCAPCVRWDCDALYCLRSLPVEAVWDSLERTLRAGSAGDGRLCTRRQRYDWETLRELGFDLPLASVLFLPERDFDPADETWARGFAAQMAVVAAQRYPSIEVVVAVPEGCELPSLPHVDVRCVHAARAGSWPDWNVLLEHARGELVAPLVPGIRWAPGKLGADVAVLMQQPAVQVAATRVAGSSASTLVGAATFRRSVAREWLERGGQVEKFQAAGDCEWMAVHEAPMAEWAEPAAGPVVERTEDRLLATIGSSPTDVGNLA